MSPIRISRLPGTLRDNWLVVNFGFSLDLAALQIHGAAATARIQSVDADGPAARAGIRAGDVVVAIEGHDVTGRESHLVRPLLLRRPGDVVRFRLARGPEIDVPAMPR